MPDLSNIFLITDMDGTLLPENKILSDRDKSAIKRFRKDGGKFTIATGRTLQSALKYIKELEIDLPVILYNGSLLMMLCLQTNCRIAPRKLPQNSLNLWKIPGERF